MSMAGVLGDIRLKVTLACLPTRISLCCSPTQYLIPGSASRLTQITLSAMLQMASIIVQPGKQLISPHCMASPVCFASILCLHLICNSAARLHRIHMTAQHQAMSATSCSIFSMSHWLRQRQRHCKRLLHQRDGMLLLHLRQQVGPRQPPPPAGQPLIVAPLLLQLLM